MYKYVTLHIVRPVLVYSFEFIDRLSCIFYDISDTSGTYKYIYFYI